MCELPAAVDVYRKLAAVVSVHDDVRERRQHVLSPELPPAAHHVPEVGYFLGACLEEILVVVIDFLLVHNYIVELGWVCIIHLKGALEVA